MIPFFIFIIAFLLGLITFGWLLLGRLAHALTKEKTIRVEVTQKLVDRLSEAYARIEEQDNALLLAHKREGEGQYVN